MRQSKFDLFFYAENLVFKPVFELLLLLRNETSKSKKTKIVMLKTKNNFDPVILIFRGDLF